MGIEMEYHAETAVLGALLIDNSGWDEVGDYLAPEDFQLALNKKIFRIIRKLISENKNADVICVSQLLAAEQNDETDESFVSVCEIANHSFTSANIKHYAEIVKQKSLDRKIIKAAQNIIASVNEQKENRLDYAQQQFADIADESTHNVVIASDLLPEVLNSIDNRYHNQGTLLGLSTGFTTLDNITHGLHNGDLIILAARPAMGKTLLAMNIVEHVTLVEKKTAIIFSLEMSKSQLMERSIASISKLENEKIKSGQLNAPDFEKISGAISHFHDARLFIDDTASLSVHEIRAKCRRIKRDFGLNLVVIDYLTLMSGDGENETIRIGNISRGLKILARELNVPVIVISQLNRSLEQRNNKRPVMADLRQSGAIEQDADLIWFIYRDEAYNTASSSKGIAEIIIAKHRNGNIGTINLAFNNHLCRFDDLNSASLHAPKNENTWRGKTFEY